MCADEHKRGYIALMATIVISLVLLVMTTEIGITGWYTRFDILGSEAKETSAALAKNCAQQAVALLIIDSAYAGDATSTVPEGTCHIFPVEFDTPEAGSVTIMTQGISHKAYTNLLFVYTMHNVHFGTPLPISVVMVSVPTVTLVSYREIPTAP